ncbi:hypothetical protein AB0K46_09910, partial [Streptomyces cinnamoneus]
PASAGKVVTVAASNQWDEETDFSNWGSCLGAAGVHVVSESALGSRAGAGQRPVSRRARRP